MIWLYVAIVLFLLCETLGFLILNNDYNRKFVRRDLFGQVMNFGLLYWFLGVLYIAVLPFSKYARKRPRNLELKGDINDLYTPKQ